MDMDVISCDENGEWILPVEEHYENDFFDILHSCKSYEEFMMNSDLANKLYDASYFGFVDKQELDIWIKDYYMRICNDR